MRLVFCVALAFAIVAVLMTRSTASSDSDNAGAQGLTLSAPQTVTLLAAVRITAVPGLMVGDTTMDGQTNIIDAMFVAQHTVGLRTLDIDQSRCADTNPDSAVNIVDAMHIAQFTVDPTGASGVLFKALFDEDYHQGMLDPLAAS